MRKLTIIILVTLFFSCENENPAGCDGHDSLNFISLVAENDTIETGGSTTITATAEGYELSFEWTAEKGFIFPGESDNIVTYTASPCSIGEITITCKATDACENSETKTLIIVVL